MISASGYSLFVKHWFWQRSPAGHTCGWHSYCDILFRHSDSRPHGFSSPGLQLQRGISDRSATWICTFPMTLLAWDNRGRELGEKVWVCEHQELNIWVLWRDWGKLFIWCLQNNLGVLTVYSLDRKPVADVKSQFFPTCHRLMKFNTWNPETISYLWSLRKREAKELRPHLIAGWSGRNTIKRLWPAGRGALTLMCL